MTSLRDAELAKRDYDLNKFAVPWMFFFTGNCSIPASEFWNVGGFDENFQGWGCEDLDLGLRLYKNILHWTDFDSGGHFAAMEKPDLLVEDVRKFARSWRG